MGDRAGRSSDVRGGRATGRDERCDVLHSRCWAMLCALFLVVLCSVQPSTAQEDPPVVRLLPVEEKELFREQLIARMNAIKAAIQAQEAEGSEAEGSDTVSFLVGEDQKRLEVVRPVVNGDSAATLSVPERSLAYLAHADLSDWEPSRETCDELGPIGEWQLSAGEYSIESVLQLISSRRTALRQKEVCLRLQEERIAALGASAAFDGRCDCGNESVGGTSDGPRWNVKAGEEISVVYTVDEYSFPGLGASINSVLKHVSPENMHRLRFKVLVGRGERELLTNWLYHHLDTLYGAGGGDGRRWPFDVEVKEFTNTNLPPYFVRGPKATRLSKDIVFARFFLDDYFVLDKYVYLDADVIVRRDITELWSAVWGQPEKQSPLQNVLHAFRNCGSGYHHFFDMKNQAVSGRFVPRRCTFESGFYLVNGTGWRENNVTAQLSEWVLLNSQVPLYIGAVKAPLMALFYDRYDNIENIANLNWTHATSLGKTTFAAPHVLPEASSLEWTGPLKPWLPNGRSLVKYWEPYAFTDPTFAKYKWEAEDQARKGRDENGAHSTDNSGGYSEILKHVSENVEVGKYLTEQELRELRSLLQIDLALHNSGEFSSSNKLLLLVFGTILVVLFYCLHCGKRQHRYEAMQLARVQYHMRRVRVVKEVTLTLAEENADGQ